MLFIMSIRGKKYRQDKIAFDLQYVNLSAFKCISCIYQCRGQVYHNGFELYMRR